MKNIVERKGFLAVLLTGAVLLAAVFVAACSGTAGNNGSNNAKTPANANSTPAVPANAPIGANPPNQSGSPTASVTLEEFADFQCPQCASTHPTINEIKSLYGSRIHFIFRNFPLQIPAHDKSYEAAVAAEAAGMQGANKFFEMQNLLFTNQKAWTDSPGYKETWKGYAKTIGLDVEKWENDRAGIGAKGRVDADMARGKGLNVNGTPTAFINGAQVQFADMNVDGLKKLIDAELAKSSGAKPAAANTAPAANDSKSVSVSIDTANTNAAKK